MKATRHTPLLRGINDRYPAQYSQGINENEEERLSLAFAVLPHMSSFKEESDEFFIFLISIRGSVLRVHKIRKKY